MSADLLPESVNLFLDDFETSLCLPILVVMVLCTAQFVFNHAFGIGYTIYQSVRGPGTEEEEEERDKTDMMGRLKDLPRQVLVNKANGTQYYFAYWIVYASQLGYSFKSPDLKLCTLISSGMLTALGIGKAARPPIRNPQSPEHNPRSREEEWDYCEEDIE